MVDRQGAARSESMIFRCRRTLAQFLAVKGSVALDGVSLTINKVTDSTNAVDIEVNIVPHTLTVTTLGSLESGDSVHVEVDLVARYLKRLWDCQK